MRLFIQVDIQLIDWPDSNGVRMGLSTVFGGLTRTSFGTSADFSGLVREYLISGFDPVGGEGVFVESEVTTGKLRLVRIGNTFRAYFSGAESGEEWVLVNEHTATQCHIETSISLTVWTHNYAFTNKDVRVAFDNFVIRTRAY